MTPLSQLKQMRQQMLDELLKMPEYRAAHAMKKFIEEMSEIMGDDGASTIAQDEAHAHNVSKAIERRIIEGAREGAPVRVQPFSP